MHYRLTYREDADVLTIIVRDKGELSHAMEMARRQECAPVFVDFESLQDYSYAA